MSARFIKCVACGVTVPARSNYQLYCCIECKQAARRTPPRIIECAMCSAIVVGRGRGISAKKYCAECAVERRKTDSRRRAALRKARRHAAYRVIECAGCGLNVAARRNSQRYCTDCGRRRYRCGPRIFSCVDCGATVAAGSGAQKYCLECRARRRKQRRPDYNASPELRERRCEINRNYRHSPKGKARAREYRQRPDVRQRQAETYAGKAAILEKYFGMKRRPGKHRFALPRRAYCLMPAEQLERQRADNRKNRRRRRQKLEAFNELLRPGGIASARAEIASLLPPALRDLPVAVFEDLVRSTLLKTLLSSNTIDLSPPEES